MDIELSRPRNKFLVFGAPAIEEAEIAEVVESMRSGWLGTGPKVAHFEKVFKQYRRSPHAVAVNSCTAALHLCILASGIGPGDEVITTALTFCATVNAIIHAGATPVLVDVEPDTMNIDPTQIEMVITSRTKAIVPVHFAGRPCNMDAITDIAQRYKLSLIEDCAHAVEAEYHSRPVGTFGDFGCYSFYVTKNVVTGEGGMIITPHSVAAGRIKNLALHGMSKDAWRRFDDEGYKHYKVVAAGFKYNMMDLQAAIGIHQLERVESNWKRRQDIWNIYNNSISSLPITTPADPEPDTRHSYHLYTILIDGKSSTITRDKFLEEMTKSNIGVGVHYLSIPEHPFYRKSYGWQPEDYPIASKIGRTTVSLPLSAALTNNDVKDVITTITRILR